MCGGLPDMKNLCRKKMYLAGTTAGCECVQHIVEKIFVRKNLLDLLLSRKILLPQIGIHPPTRVHMDGELPHPQTV